MMHPRAFVTQYSKDYTWPSVINRRRFYTSDEEFDSPIVQIPLPILDLDDKSPKPPRENLNIYLEKFKEKKPEVGERYFKEPPNSETVKIDNACAQKGLYFQHYCSTGTPADYIKVAKKRWHLPLDIKLPDSTYLLSYRNPTLHNERAYEKREILIAPDNLRPSEKLRSILHIETGISDYMAHIGRLGGFGVRENIHGPLKRPTEEECLLFRIRESRIE